MASLETASVIHAEGRPGHMCAGADGPGLQVTPRYHHDQQT